MSLFGLYLISYWSCFGLGIPEVARRTHPRLDLLEVAVHSGVHEFSSRTIQDHSTSTSARADYMPCQTSRIEPHCLIPLLRRPDRMPESPPSMRRQPPPIRPLRRPRPGLDRPSGRPRRLPHGPRPRSWRPRLSKLSAGRLLRHATSTPLTS